VYGLSDVPSNSVNLSADGEPDLRVAYVAAHTAVIHDKHAGTQTFLQVCGRQTESLRHQTLGTQQCCSDALQGHCNAITCMQATADRSLLITADAGLDNSLLVFWDPETGQPVTTVQRPHAGGVLAMAVSASGQHLATLSAPGQSSSEDTSQQKVSGANMLP
jgi:WD40 repeat protein